MALETSLTITKRGFRIWNFRDRNGERCSLQESSLADEPAIWFGANECRIEVLNHRGHTEIYELPRNAIANQRMHLTRNQVQALLPILQHFVEHGTLGFEPPDGNRP